MEIHGLWFLAGLSAALAAWLLFCPTTALVAHALLLTAGLLFAHGYSGYADPRLALPDFYPLEPMWTYGYWLLAALLLHFAWRFPPHLPTTIRPLLQSTSPRLVILYGLAFTLGTIQELTRAVKWIDANVHLSQLSLVVAAIGAVVGLIRISWLSFHQPSQAHIRVFAGLWGVGSLFVLGIGIVPFWLKDVSMFLSQLLLSIAVLYPLLLVYAVRQLELVEARHQIPANDRLLMAEQSLVSSKTWQPVRLTPREQEVLNYLAQGLTNKEIAQKQVISVRTVETHVQDVFKKLKVHSRVEAVDRARTLGLLSDDSPEVGQEERIEQDRTDASETSSLPKNT